MKSRVEAVTARPDWSYPWLRWEEAVDKGLVDVELGTEKTISRHREEEKYDIVR